MKHPCRIVLGLIALFTCALAAQGQQYVPEVHRYGVKEGLSHRQVNDIIQDKRGYIWVATPSGVNRFDGYSFRVWSREDGLETDQVTKLFEDAEGFIWAMNIVASDKSISNIDLIDPSDNSVIPFAAKYGNKIRGGFQDKFGKPVLGKDSTLYWATKNGYITYHPTRGFDLVETAGVPPGFLHNFSIDLVTHQKTVWGVADEQNLVEIGPQGNILHRFPGKWSGFTQPMRLSGERVLYYDLMSPKPVLQLVNADGQQQPEAEGKVALPHPFFQAASFAPIFGDRLSFIAMQVIDQKTDRLLIDLSQTFPEIGTIPTAWLIDRLGKIWIGTDFGLILLTIHENRFKRFLFNGDATKRGTPCRGILQKDGRLLVATETGFFSVDTATGVSRQLPGEFMLYYNVLYDSTEGLIIGHDHGLARVPDPAKWAPEQLTEQKHRFFWAVFPDHRHRLWIGTYDNGLLVYDFSTGQTTGFSQYNGFTELEHAEIVSIQADREGKVWLCASTGFYLLDLEKGIMERHWSCGTGAEYLPFDRFYHFYQDTEGIFWLATGGGGLIRWDRKQGIVTQYSKKAGLPNNTIYAVYEDAHQHLWLPSDYGIIQFDKATGKVRRVYLPEDGITYPEFNRISHFRDSDGTLFFGGLNGITAFHPNQFYENDLANSAPLVINRLQQFDGESNRLTDKTNDLRLNNVITIRPNDRFIDLDFALLTFEQTDKIQYAYKIEGLDANWTYQNEHSLRLSRLPYGEYTLHIRGQAANGLWGANDLDLTIRVLRPFYLQWWFWLLCLAVAGLGVRYFFLRRTRQLKLDRSLLQTEVERQTATIRQQAEELRQLDIAKTRFFANVAHELRTPLTLTLAPLSSMLKRRHLGNEDSTLASLAQQNAQNLLHLVNEILDLTKLEAGKMELHEVPVVLFNLVRLIVSNFESYAERQNIRLRFDYQPDKYLQIELDPNKFEKILNNLLANAFKFSSEGSVNVTVLDLANRIQIEVADTGRGIHPDDLPWVFDRFYQSKRPDAPVEGGTGIGLSLCMEFAKLFQGKLWVESELGKGSTFYFSFPKKEIMGRIADAEALEIQQIGEREAGAHASPGVLNIPPAQEGTGATILVVEDNHSLRDYLQMILQARYTVVTAENGLTALECLRANPSVALVLSDIMMPLMDGFQLLSALKSSAEWRSLPVVMLTARADMQDKLKALRIGVDDYLLKPFEEEEVLVRIGNLLKNAGERRQFLAAEPAQATETGDPPHSLEELEWLETLETYVKINLGNSNLTAESIADGVNTSRAQLFRRIKSLTGLTPNEYLNEVRFNFARQGLESRTFSSVKSAAYAVGMLQLSYFSQQFKARFGKSPADYLR